MPTDERDEGERSSAGAESHTMPEPQPRWGNRRRVMSSAPPQQSGGREVLDIDPDELTEDDLLAALNDALKANDAKPRGGHSPAPTVSVESGGHAHKPLAPPQSVTDHLSWADPPPAINRLPSGRRGGPAPKKPRPPIRVPTETRIQIATLEAKLGEAETETEKAQKKLGQMSAETVSYRKRLEDRAMAARLEGQRDVLGVLVNVVDNFETAMSASARGSTSAETDTVLKGLQMVLRQMLNDLKPFGLTTFKAVGEPFDPSRHEAIRHVHTGTVEPGHVAVQMRRGFELHGRLFRAAMVAVEAPPES